jgi:uncharacterized coiled-coil protein SlyX
MAVPWLQIVNLMPSILDVSRELLKRTRKVPPPAEGQLPNETGEGTGALEARIRALEENERRQAELIKSMADQLAQLADAATALHRLTRWLIAGVGVAAIMAVAALVFALR